MFNNNISLTFQCRYETKVVNLWIEGQAAKVTENPDSYEYKGDQLQQTWDDYHV